MALPVLQPSRVTLMIKPVGALCNLECTYCYYLPTKAVFDGHQHRMSRATLRNVFASLLPKAEDHVMIAWQGGEPTLAGLDFFNAAIEYCKTYARPGQTISHSLQTNGTLLNDEWCRFFASHQFLIGLSLDGPPDFHDHYRLTNQAKPSSDQVLAGMNLLQKHGVEYNILCVLNDRNVHYPDQVLGYLLNLGMRWVQFIPAIEWIKAADPARAVGSSGNQLAPYSPDPQAYGRFLCRVFDLWFEKYRKRVSVRIFDAVLNKLVLGVMPFCILDGSCHNQLTIEHDGSVFGCDHFVERRWQLGRIGEPGWCNTIQLDGSTAVGLTVHGSGMVKSASHAGRNIADIADLPAIAEPASDQADDSLWLDRLDSGRLHAFAQRKQHLPDQCVRCQWKPFCHGGCPKHRASGGDAPEPTILCPAYMQFYEHAMPRLQWLADFLRRNQQPPDPQGQAARPLGQTARSQEPRAGPPNRNDPCPCGSGIKYKRCHGKNR